jgi:leucine-rich repeat protein SHOC2
VVRLARPRYADANVLRAWRAVCPELRALWDESQPVTAWAGVTFGKAGGASAGRVVQIAMKGEGLTGDLPAELGGLTALTTWVVQIAMKGEGLTGDLPAALGRLTALTTLNLSRNQLASVPAELRGLTALTTLNLSGNQLTSVPAALGRLTALRELHLNGNKLTTVPAALGRLTALTTLDLNGNQLTSVPAELGRLTALSVLGLNDNLPTSVRGGRRCECCRKKPERIRACAGCGAHEAAKLCSACLFHGGVKVRYCDEQCQLRHWRSATEPHKACCHKTLNLNNMS